MAQGADNSPLLVHDENSEGRFSKPISEEGHLISGRRSRKKFLVVVCILFVELCERLTFYGVVANLIFYCKDVLNLASPLPSTIALASEGTCFFTPVIGGWIADTFVGRYNTIFGSSLLYVVGTVLLTVTTYNYQPTYAIRTSNKERFLAVSLILISIGTGGIKANVSSMGADQIEDEGPEMVQKFFDWFYWFIQIGSFLACTVVAYVQQEVSFFYGYLITAVSMALATILLLLGRNHYIVYPPRGSYLADTFRIIASNVKKKLYGIKCEVQDHWLDGAKTSKGGDFPDDKVEGVKCVVRLMPIFVTFIVYWTIFGQSLTSYVLQGSYMNLKVTDKISFPVASLSLFENVSLLLLIPLMDRVIFPGLRRLGFEFTPLRRIGVGLLFAAGSVVMAGIIEIERKHILETHGAIKQDVFDKQVNASSMSVFYQVPQYILQGTSEALVSVTGLEFAYSQSPAELRGVVMGLCLAMIGFGYYLASALASIVKKASDGQWYPDNLNKGTLEDYMFLLAGLMLVNAAIFLLLALRYRYADHEHHIQEEDLSHTSGEKDRIGSCSGDVST